MANYEGFKSRTTSTQFLHHDDAGDAGRRFLRGPHAAAGSDHARENSEPDRHRLHRHLDAVPGNQIPSNRFNPASVYLLNNFAPLPNLRADRSAESQLSIRRQDAGGQGPVHRPHRFQRERELAMVRPLQLDRRTDRHSRRPVEWHHPLHQGQPVGARQHARVLVVQGERIPLRLQLALQQHQPGTCRAWRT